MALVFTQANLDALKEAFLTGALEVQIGDRRIKYRSQSELLKAINTIEEYLNGVSSDVADNPSVIQSGYSRKPVCDE